MLVYMNVTDLIGIGVIVYGQFVW